jgi:hypothetical protein
MKYRPDVGVGFGQHSVSIISLAWSTSSAKEILKTSKLFVNGKLLYFFLDQFFLLHQHIFIAHDVKATSWAKLYLHSYILHIELFACMHTKGCKSYMHDTKG